MNAGNSKADPWPKILDSLKGCYACANAESQEAPATNRVGAATRVRSVGKWHANTPSWPICATINVLEVTETSATIAWYDPTRCRYEDQRWSRLKTHQAGVCAMTGTRIAAGDDVFHPVRTRSGPANADALILARAAMPRCCRIGPRRRMKVTLGSEASAEVPVVAPQAGPIGSSS